jgi:hypothetical protein
VTGVRNDRHLVVVAAKCYEKVHFVRLVSFLFLASLSCFLALSVRNP